VSSKAYQGRYMIRRKHEAEHENHERWVISYADFITLLFAFFVVMYSISSVNEGKYKVLSDSLVSVFHAQSRTIDPVTVGEQQTRASNDQLIQLPVPGEYPAKDDYKYTVEGVFDDVIVRSLKQGEMRDKEIDRLSKLSEQMAITLEQQIKADQVQIKNNGEWLEVDIQASVLFPSGSAGLQPAAMEILGRLSSVLKDVPNPIHVEGYTDNVPIETEQFPSNWELSAARAASVVRLFQEQKLDPSRLAAVGYAEFQPVADNKTEEGRARNRRISLVISKSGSDGKTEAPAAPDYKLGAADPREDGKGQRMRTTEGVEVPVRVIRLEDGGVLFSGDKPAPSQPASAQPAQTAP